MSKGQQITYFGCSVVSCDRKCHKAWGINNRPQRKLSEDEDDYVFLSDSALAEAPEDPGTYEGFQGKPGNAHTGPLNKWCVRECERSVMVDSGEELVLPDFDNPEPNLFSRREKPS